MQLKFDLSGMLTGHWFFFCKIADKSHVTLKSLTASPICFKEGPYPGHIRFWCDSDFTFFTWIEILTVPYFSIIEVFWLKNLCGVSGDSSFVIIRLRTVGWVVSVYITGSCPPPIPFGHNVQSNFGYLENKQQPLWILCKKHKTKQLQVYFISALCYKKFEQHNNKYNLKKNVHTIAPEMAFSSSLAVIWLPWLYLWLDLQQ